MDASGQIQNSYQYDPFGKVIQQSERLRNFYKYIGRLGVISDEELQHIFMMRDRHYDAQHGRFISMDPIGIINQKQKKTMQYKLMISLSCTCHLQDSQEIAPISMYMHLTHHWS